MNGCRTNVVVYKNAKVVTRERTAGQYRYAMILGCKRASRSRLPLYLTRHHLKLPTVPKWSISLPTSSIPSDAILEAHRCWSTYVQVVLCLRYESMASEFHNPDVHHRAQIIVESAAHWMLYYLVCSPMLLPAHIFFIFGFMKKRLMISTHVGQSHLQLALVILYYGPVSTS